MPDAGGVPSFSPSPYEQPGPPQLIPLPFSKELQDEIVKFACDFMRSSAEYVEAKKFDWELANKLYEGKIGIREWEDMARGRKTREQPGDTPSDEAYSDYVHDIAPIINQWVDMAHQMIFGGPQWGVVEPVGKDADAMSAMALTKLFTGKMDEAQFEARTNDALLSEALYGSVVEKVCWYGSMDSPRKHIDPETGQTFDIDSDPWNEGPLCQIVPLEDFLPDWRAKHNDVQRWRACGHRVKKTHDDIMIGYQRGVYTLNEDEFQERFQRTDGGNQTEENILAGDEEGLSEDDPNNWLQVWEFHGRASTSRGSYEVVVVKITEQDCDDPSDGVTVRVSDGPALDMGKRKLRPFALDHYHQRPRPFGEGLYSSSRGTTHTISRLVGMFLDHLHIILQSPFGCDPGSVAYKELKEDGGKLKPGKMLSIEEGTMPITEVPRPQYPTGDNLTAIQFFGRLLEEQTLTQASRGLETSSRQSATEISALLQQSQTPTEVRIRLFCKNLLNPVMTMALNLIRIFADEDQVHWQSVNGEYEQTIVPLEVLQGPGEYRVFAAITKQDATANVRAQTIQQLLQQAQVLDMLAQAEGKKIMWTELITQLFHRLDLDNIDRLIQSIPPPPMMPQEQIGPMGQPEMQQGPPPEIPPGMDGTPAGPPTDANQYALMLQMQAAQGMQPQ